VADPVAKSANPAGATAGKPAAAAPSAASSAAPAAGAKPAASGPTAPKAQPPAPKPITTVDDLIEQAEDRVIPKGSTVRVSPNNGDASTKAQQEELEDSLEACGIKLIWDKSIAKDAIVVEGAKAK